MSEARFPRLGAGRSERGLGAGTQEAGIARERHEVEAVQDARLVLYLAPWPGPGTPSRSD